MSEDFTESDIEELIYLELKKNRILNNLMRIMERENELFEKADEKLINKIASRKKTPGKNTKKRNT